MWFRNELSSLAEVSLLTNRMLLKRLPAPILIINHVHFLLVPCLQPPLLWCFGCEFPRQSLLLPDVQLPVFTWVKTTLWSPEINKVLGFTMRNVAKMNYHFNPPPPPDLIPKRSPDLLLTHFSSQTVRSITSHVRSKWGNVNLMQERQILATHQGHVQYKDGVQFTTGPAFTPL